MLCLRLETRKRRICFFGVTVNFIGLCVVIVIIWTTVVFTCIMKDMNVD